MSRIEDKVIAKILIRAAIGRRKYGTDMERKDLSLQDWILHLQEELMDGAIYCEKLLDILEKLSEIED